MTDRGSKGPGWKASVGGMLLACWGVVAWAAPEARLQVAVAAPDVEAIVRSVGGDQVEAFTLFTGCILRKDLEVETSALPRLVAADAVVWTGFMPEALAVRIAVSRISDSMVRNSWCPQWIDVSRGVAQVDPAVSSLTSSCEGYVDLVTSHGDPFFWLNPENGAVIADEVANGLGKLRPAEKAGFTARASAFRAALRRDIVRWKEQLRPLSKLTVFTTQCGWQNAARLGGPTFVVCKKVPGCVLSPQALVDYARQMKVNVVLLDTNTPARVAKALREAAGWKVFDVPSSIAEIDGARTYADLFDHMVHVLQEAARTP